MNQSFYKMWVLIVFVAIIVGGIFAWQFEWLKREVKMPEVKTPEEIITDETANWQTYRNEEYGFELKYPLQWQIRSSPNTAFGVEFIPSEKGLYYDFWVYIEDNPQHLLLEDYFKAQKQVYLKEPGHVMYFPFEDIEPSSVTEVDGRVAYQFIRPGVVGVFSTILSYGDYIFYLNSNSTLLYEQARDTYNQILSTFKFIKKTDTSNWQTYRNEEYGFEFKYPKVWNLGREESLINEYNKILLMISISKNNDPNQRFSVWIDQENPPLFIYEAPEKESLVIDNINTTAYIYPYGYECYEDQYQELGGDCSGFEIPIRYRDLWYRIIAQKKAKGVTKEYSNILSTFKFIK